MEIDNKRYPHTYKTKKSVYNKAVKRAKKEKGTLANLIENIVICYGQGLDIKAVSPLDSLYSSIQPIKQ